MGQEGRGEVDWVVGTSPTGAVVVGVQAAVTDSSEWIAAPVAAAWAQTTRGLVDLEALEELAVVPAAD